LIPGTGRQAERQTGRQAERNHEQARRMIFESSNALVSKFDEKLGLSMEWRPFKPKKMLMQKRSAVEGGQHVTVLTFQRDRGSREQDNSKVEEYDIRVIKLNMIDLAGSLLASGLTKEVGIHLTVKSQVTGTDVFYRCIMSESDLDNFLRAIKAFSEINNADEVSYPIHVTRSPRAYCASTGRPSYQHDVLYPVLACCI